MNKFQIYNVPEFGTNAPVRLETADAALKDMAMSAMGNMAGGAFNTAMNTMLQQRQFEEQEKLQGMAYKNNQRAVANQAQLQAQGMQNAGLNPAAVTGTGAPSVQSGAAAGSTSTMGNIFSGIAEIVAAAKAPSEIERNQAEAVQRGAETTMIPTEIAKMQQEMGLFAEQARGMKNENEFIEAHNRFIKEQAPKVFENYIGQLKANGVWENLPKETRETYEKMAMGADGISEYGMGLVRGINDIIRINKGLSDTDKEILDNTKQMIIAYNQIMDEKVMNAFRDMPIWQQNLMKAEITEFYAMAEEAKTEADWNKTRKWLDEHTSDTWLIEHGMNNAIERKKWGELFNNLANFPFRLMEGIAPAATGATILRNKPTEHKPIITEVKNTVGKKQNKTTYKYLNW